MTDSIYTEEALRACERTLVDSQGDSTGITAGMPDGMDPGEWLDGMPAAYLHCLIESGRLSDEEVFGLALIAARLVAGLDRQAASESAGRKQRTREAAERALAREEAR